MQTYVDELKKLANCWSVFNIYWSEATYVVLHVFWSFSMAFCAVFHTFLFLRQENIQSFR